MNKLLLALIALSAGVGAVHTARQSTTRLEQEAEVLRDDWLAHSQTVASAQADLAGVNERIRELKQSLRQSRPATDTGLWSALQTNRADRLPMEFRERLREELGFNWQFSPDYIVVSKQTVRDLQMPAITRGGKLLDLADTVLALTSEERGQVEAAIERVPMEFKDWALAHVQRTEPKDDVLAEYFLPIGRGGRESIGSLSNNLLNAVSHALGNERAEVILPSSRDWMVNGIGLDGIDAWVKVRRVLVGNEQRLKVQMTGGRVNEGYLPLPLNFFPRLLQPIFPNGWADLAKREGFELPEEPQKK